MVSKIEKPTSPVTANDYVSLFMKSFTSFIYNVLCWFIYGVFWFFSLAPRRWLRWLSAGLYVLLCKVVRYRRDVVLQNLSRAFPTKNYSEIIVLTRLFYLHFSSLLTGVLELFSISSEALKKRVRLENPDILHKYLQKGRDLIVVTGHYGNWEYLNILPEITEYDVYAIYKPMRSGLAAALSRRFRSRFGMKLIPAGQAARKLMRPSARPRLAILIGDQYPGTTAARDFNFMNQQTAAFAGAEKMARATGAVVLYLEMTSHQSGCWELRHSVITETPGGCLPGEITAVFLDKLQASIVRRPELWLWSHRRWKHPGNLPVELQAAGPSRSERPEYRAV
ncbi:lysophospholipid acyltransferase family protein [Pedobacter sp. SYP-B3415]|uniref:lysophospholipid acyltransferase family protein n=1 Tax=Pedobacter sp. SYP-B3415 TaxID=2496641 RepID=UPI00101B658E|nr:lysophospholipid acyltransferase family protein [Pedobacter sp. SYP-B3415]